MPQPEPGQVPGDGAAVHRDAVDGEFVSDPRSRPVGAPPGLDLNDDLRHGRLGAVVRHRGPVEKAEVAVGSPTVDPLRRTRTRDTHLGGDVRDRAMLAALDQSATTFGRERGITVSHGQVLCWLDTA